MGNQTLKVADATNDLLSGTGTVSVSSARARHSRGTLSIRPRHFFGGRQQRSGFCGHRDHRAGGARGTACNSNTGGSPPSAIMQTPPTPVTGNVMISYALVDANENVCSIQVQYSGDGGTTWQNATEAPGGDGMTNLASSTASLGFAHEYMWASGADIGSVYNTDVEIRITPTDSVAGAVGADTSAANFSVNNTTTPEPGDRRHPSSIVIGEPVQLCRDAQETNRARSLHLQLVRVLGDPNAVVPSNGQTLTSGVGSFERDAQYGGPAMDCRQTDIDTGAARQSKYQRAGVRDPAWFHHLAANAYGRRRFRHDHDRFGKHLWQCGQRGQAR